MDSFNFINSPILIAGYIVCLVLVVLSYIKAIKFNDIFIIVLFVALTGLSIYSLLIGTSYVEVTCFILLYLILILFHFLKRKEKA